MGLLRRRSPD